MSGMNLKKMNREATKKMKAQRKQEKRKQKQTATAEKAITGTSANGKDLAVENPRRRSA